MEKKYYFSSGDPRAAIVEYMHELVHAATTDSVFESSEMQVSVLWGDARAIKKLHLHINEYCGGEVISQEQIKTLAMMRGIQVLRRECDESMNQTFTGLERLVGKPGW